MAELGEYSRFKNTPEIVVDGKVTYGRWVPPSFIRERPDDSVINRFKVTTETEGRPDEISYAVYGTSRLDWVIIAFNDIHNPMGWPKAGDIIEYPDESIVFPEIL